jgi:hypothetical protein
VEVGAEQDPSRLQRTLNRLWLVVADIDFQTELAVTTHVTVSDTHTIVSDIRDDVSKIREGIGGQVQPVSASWIRFVNNRRMLIIP